MRGLHSEGKSSIPGWYVQTKNQKSVLLKSYKNACFVLLFINLNRVFVQKSFWRLLRKTLANSYWKSSTLKFTTKLVRTLLKFSKTFELVKQNTLVKETVAKNPVRRILIPTNALKKIVLSLVLIRRENPWFRQSNWLKLLMGDSYGIDFVA